MAEQLAPAKLEPTTLAPSRKPWRAILAGGSVLCAGSLAGAVYSGDTATLFLAALFGLSAALGAVMLLPGAHSLRLDDHGFEVEHFFLKKRYRWNDVSGFAVRKVGQYDQLVAFDTTAAVHRNLWEKINGARSAKAGICRTPMGWRPTIWRS